MSRASSKRSWPVLTGRHFGQRVLVVERTFPERWEEMLEAAKYVGMQFDGINDFFVRNEDVELLGPKIEQPATTVLDACDPYHYVMQLEEATRSILDLPRRTLDSRSS